MNIFESINHFLPKIEIIIPKNEVDYYGFSYYLSDKLRRTYNYSFSSWTHGWIFNELKYIEQFNIAQYSPLFKIVANNTQKLFLNNCKLENVQVAGYPYIYIDNNPKIKRYQNSLLIIPPHNTNLLDHKWDEEKYIQSILKYKRDYESIFFCIHQECYKKKKWISFLNKYGINYVIGANSHDRNSLIRTKYIFQHFDAVHAPTIGAAITYAALDGCKISLSQDYLEYRIEGYHKHPLYKSKKDYVEYEIYTKSKEYIEKKFNFLFCEPKHSQKYETWAKKELGTKHKRNINEIPHLLGWNKKDKVRLYLLKYFNTLKRRVIR
ncbi:MAG: hypothetical protein CMK44_00675 [Porticoccus sp.]|nr:hypothetical protein [Porticoccus sp.]